MRKTNGRRRLPALRSLQVFAVAARHENLTSAADELGVTQSAVSRQVQELEAWLGRRLFTRSGPNLRLTAVGAVLGARLEPLMESLADAVADACAVAPSSAVTLSMLPSVAARWLAPRLGDFLHRHPGVDLRITASRHLVDFAAEGVDAAIRYGKGNWRGVTAELLARETVYPVCSPAFAASHALKHPGDLLKVTLFHSDLDEDWPAWFQKAGIDADRLPTAPYLEDDSAALQAAIDGQGVTLGRSVLIERDLAAGLLVIPFSIGLDASFSYYFVAPGQSRSPALEAVRDWLIGEFSRHRPPTHSTAP